MAHERRRLCQQLEEQGTSALWGTQFPRIRRETRSLVVAEEGLAVFGGPCCYKKCIQFVLLILLCLFLVLTSTPHCICLLTRLLLLKRYCFGAAPSLWQDDRKSCVRNYTPPLASMHANLGLAGQSSGLPYFATVKHFKTRIFFTSAEQVFTFLSQMKEFGVVFCAVCWVFSCTISLAPQVGWLHAKF